MSKKKKNPSKQNANRQHLDATPRDERVHMGDLHEKDMRRELSPALTEAIDAAFDEGIAGELEADTTGKTSAALSEALSRPSGGPTNRVMTALDWCGSMVIAIVLMLLLMVVLGWATFVENKYGPGVSLFAIYRSWWFDALLALFGFNVLCAMLARLPWRRGHVPFVVAHLGVLILLIGCWVTSRYGIEAQLTVYEGELGRFAQKTTGDEIDLEIIDFCKPPNDVGKSDEKTNESDEAVHERWAREKLASQRDQTKVKPPAPGLQEELDALALNRRERISVTLGPMSWREYDTRSNWLEGKTPWFLGIPAPTDWVYKPLQHARRSKGTVYEKDGIRVDLLDYMADSRLKPAEPLKLRVQTIAAPKKTDDDAPKEKPESENAAPVWATYDLTLGQAAGDSRGHDTYLASRPNERISYRLAKSNAETTAFLEMTREKPSGVWGVVIMRVGGENHVIPVDELIKRQTQFGMQLNNALMAKDKAEYEAAALKVRQLAPDDETEAAEIKSRLAAKETEIEQLDKRLAVCNAKIRMKIGETGLSVEMPRFLPDYLQMLLAVTREDGTPYSIALVGDQPLSSTVPDALGMQVMYLFDPDAVIKGQPGQPPSMPLERAMKPRLDLMQGRDQKLYYRFWDGRQYSQSGEMSVDRNVLALDGHDRSVWNVVVDGFEPQDYPGLKLVAEPYKNPTGRSMAGVPCVKVRVRVDGVGDETYWVQKTPFLIPTVELREHQVGYVSGQNRTVAVTFPLAWLDLGFSLFLHKFERKLEPGIGMPSHFSSLVSVYPIDDRKADTTDREPLQDRVLIRMNQPGMFSDQLTGRKYRVFQTSYQGPFHPGMRDYQLRLGGYLIEGDTRPRDSLYASTLTANYDPGRGLKYLGSLMIVLGTLAFFYTKKIRKPVGLSPWNGSPVETSGMMTHETGGAARRDAEKTKYSPQGGNRMKKRLAFGHFVFALIGLLMASLVATNAVAPVTVTAQENAEAIVSDKNDDATEKAPETTSEVASVSEPDVAPEDDSQNSDDNAQEPEDETVEDEQKPDVAEKPVDETIETTPTDITPEEPAVMEVLPTIETPEVEVPAMPEPFDASAVGVSSRALDWRAWEELPVFYDGRVVPLTTFARITVTAVCGRSSPTFAPDENVLEEATGDKLLNEREAARVREKFSGGARSFRDAELVFSWLVEPEVWEYVPFLPLKNSGLRTELQAPVSHPRFGGDGPEYVSPYQVKKHAVALQGEIDRWRKLEAGQLDDGELEKLGEEGIAALKTSGPAADKLKAAYDAYRTLTNEANALPVYQLYMKLAQADRQMQNAYRLRLTLERLPVDVSQIGLSLPFSGGDALGTLSRDINEAALELQRTMYGEAEKPVTPQKLEAAFEDRLMTFDRLRLESSRFRDAVFDLDGTAAPRSAGFSAERLRMLRDISEELDYSLLQGRQWCESAWLSLYDCGNSLPRANTLQIYPALVAESIKTDRSYPVQGRDMFGREYTETSRMPVWLTLHTFLFGSDAMIRRFAIPGLPEGPQDKPQETPQTYDGTQLGLIGQVVRDGNPNRVIRSSFHDMATAYLNLEYRDLYAKDNAKNDAADVAKQVEKFNRAALAFAADLRANAESVAAWRRDLVPTERRDNELLAKTAYPAESLMRAEANYERLRPFYYMWVTSAAALMLLLASAIVSAFLSIFTPPGRNRRTLEAVLFWCGFVMLLVSEAVTLTGSCYRAYITGWAPVTNMFETIVLMAFSVAVIGIWYAFQPLFGERLLRAWRVAALPKGAQPGNTGGRFGKLSATDERRLARLQLVMLPLRVVLAIATLYYVLLLSYGEAGGGQLSWQIVRHSIAMNDPIDLAVVMISIALLVWLVPRLVLTIALFPFVGAKSSQTGVKPGVSLSHMLLDRKLFLIVGAALALAAGLAAYFNDTTFSPNIRPLMAVLRSNFWLTVHVFAIIIGYASGAIAWLLAAVACGMCIFGRWHTIRRPDGTYAPQMPDRAAAIMPYIISMLRWTMLFIAVGTILGARWADYSWGRFWGWDPKEVWALVTLLFYLTVLHGRVARYYGDFGVMLGAQFGSIAIIMTWYGANVIFKGSRHAYGGTDTSFETFVLLIFITVNLVWGFLAVFRLIVQKTVADSQTYINRR